MNNFWQILKKPIIGLCPMDGITDFPMRQIQISVAKPDVMYTEFISVEGFVRNPKAFKRKLFFKENERPIVAQLFGNTPPAFYEAVMQIGKMGFDGIDINMGCPAKSVLQKGGGGALIGNYDLAGEIIQSCLKALSDSSTSIPLSIKTRIGQKKMITDEWVEFLSSFPLSEVTVHGRLLIQNNSGEVMWEEIQKANEILHKKRIVCLGNGGVRSAKEGRELSEKYGLDGILIGQAACGNPWVFNNQKPTKEQIFKIIKEHSQLVDKFYEPKGFVSVLKHLGWYLKGFENSKKMKVELLKSKNLNDAMKIISSFENAPQII